MSFVQKVVFFLWSNVFIQVLLNSFEFLDIDCIQIFPIYCSFCVSDITTRYKVHKSVECSMFWYMNWWIVVGKVAKVWTLHIFAASVWTSRKVFIGNSIRILFHSALRFSEFIRKPWHGDDLSPQDSPRTLILDSRTTPSKLFTQKECLSSFSLNGLKSEVRWLSGSQDMDEKVKIACGDEAVKEQVYSGETLICSCSTEQGKTFEPSSCSLWESYVENDIGVDVETVAKSSNLNSGVSYRGFQSSWRQVCSYE